MATRDAALDLARSQIGVAESPSGSNHQKYGIWYGWDYVAWCAIFVSWVINNSGTPFSVTTSKGFASVDLGRAWAKKNGKWHTKNPVPGDIVIYTFSHCGIVESVRPDGSIVAIEGNTDVHGGGSGGRVMRQVRSRSIISGFITVDYSAVTPPQPSDMPSGKLNAPATAIVSSPTGAGYTIFATDGGVFAYGDCRYYGNATKLKLNKPVVDGAVTKDGNGYYLVATDGGIFAYGSARFFGSAGSLKLNQPVVGMSLSPSGNGYYLVASDGGVFCYGDAQFFGSMGGKPLNSPVVGIVASAKGYLLFAADGGVFAFGDAQFKGSMGGHKLNRPIVGGDLVGTKGYCLVGGDGGAFDFGYSPFGSMGGKKLNAPMVDVAGNPDGSGIWMVGSDGGVFAFGKAPFYGSPA